MSSPDLFKRLSEVGFSRKFVLTRLLPRSIAARLQEGARTEGHDRVVLQAASIIGQVLKFTPAALPGATPLQLIASASSAARFNVPGGQSGPG